MVVYYGTYVLICIAVIISMNALWGRAHSDIGTWAGTCIARSLPRTWRQGSKCISRTPVVHIPGPEVIVWRWQASWFLAAG